MGSMCDCSDDSCSLVGYREVSGIVLYPYSKSSILWEKKKINHTALESKAEQIEVDHS